MKLSIWILFFVFAISANCTSDENDELSDNEDVIEHEELPEHEFVTEEKTVKSGKNKGQKKYTTSLMIPLEPFIFKSISQLTTPSTLTTRLSVPEAKKHP